MGIETAKAAQHPKMRRYDTRPSNVFHLSSRSMLRLHGMNLNFGELPRFNLQIRVFNFTISNFLLDWRAHESSE
ncbi:hypothetical protein A3742_10180 [Oleiphilus sp. HI0071]|jgi:hypothetical protein|nr:hypothetical protein A3737_02755 [Oleiphilus sp. HI0065]KZY82222.1 hypothetical protein A3742_10180 [Oleiphilus sp. HI0071]KZY91593.1 hypothetical protein A3744_20385 [Oleiphilus sp. HI0073]KZZ12995.1 hypothetical protein A3751_20165 [Oleiphilus sp. HI0080]KZZ17586.1 hypothetical protein A3750_22210 [Oleiphilus sp. HI0079]KZZ42929.1 hypothetical protein A3758_04990 [Oleiphilus sp. HI0118]KZZ53719.1 hypothetical protein A3760_09375 [Oleiphilus sp. HI0122]KZZ68246.1 hypothetical protein A37